MGGVFGAVRDLAGGMIEGATMGYAIEGESIGGIVGSAVGNEAVGADIGGAVGDVYGTMKRPIRYQ